MDNWKTTLREIADENQAEHFENFAGSIDEHLMNVFRELGDVAMGTGADSEFALAELAQATSMIRLMRDLGIDIAQRAKDRAEEQCATAVKLNSENR